MLLKYNKVMNKINEVKEYLKSKPNMFVGWTYSEDPADYPVYETKAECMIARSEFFKQDCFKDFCSGYSDYFRKNKLDRMYPVRPYVFAGKFGLEENVPVCSVNEFKFN